MDIDEDPRQVELETLEAIFPEIQRLTSTDGLLFQLEIPVVPADPVTVAFTAETSHEAGPSQGGTADDSRSLSHLPSLSLRVLLRDGYPAEVPPKIDISTSPPWLSADVTARLEDDAPRLWEDAGRDMVAYTYIDHVQRAAVEDVFGAESTLIVDAVHKLALLDYDLKAREAAFDKETFDCGVCLEPKKGAKCHRMLDCGHVFCTECLKDFYGDAITQGALDTVRCLEPSCAKERGKSPEKRKKIALSPSELLRIGLPEDSVKRYVALKYKIQLEADKNTVYCPRQWCNGVARSKKHKKPNGLDDVDTDVEDERPEKEEKDTVDRADLLSVCEDCRLAFCSQCLQSWHGEYVICQPAKSNEELSAEEKASLEYINLHTSPCPTCGAPASKTHGCNHMICSRCNTHFCYLCSSWLNPGNPYAHYNTQAGGKQTSCFMRLWELEEGDDDHVGHGFAGGRTIEAPRRGPVPVAQPRRNHARQPRAELRNVEVAREAPLVLRLTDNAPAAPEPVTDNAPAAPEPVPDPLPAPAEPMRGGRGRGRGRGRGPQRHFGRGGARGGPPRVVQGRHVVQVQGELNEADQAWVRNFVQLALLDVEDDEDDWG